MKCCQSNLSNQKFIFWWWFFPAKLVKKYKNDDVLKPLFGFLFVDFFDGGQINFGSLPTAQSGTHKILHSLRFNWVTLGVVAHLFERNLLFNWAQHWALRFFERILQSIGLVTWNLTQRVKDRIRSCFFQAWPCFVLFTVINVFFELHFLVFLHDACFTNKSWKQIQIFLFRYPRRQIEPHFLLFFLLRHFFSKITKIRSTRLKIWLSCLYTFIFWAPLRIHFW